MPHKVDLALQGTELGGTIQKDGDSTSSRRTSEQVYLDGLFLLSRFLALGVITHCLVGVDSCHAMDTHEPGRSTFSWEVSLECSGDGESDKRCKVRTRSKSATESFCSRRLTTQAKLARHEALQ